jgi:hypothetical protein
MSDPTNLDFDRAPPLGVVFGCLLPAPWLGVVAGLALAFFPSADLPNRLAPLVLALVHLLAVGMLLPVMLGALFQLFPVVAGVEVPAARYLSPWVAPLCGGTAACLAWGFLSGDARAFVYAGTLACLGLSAPAMMLAWAGRRVVPVNATTATLRWIAWPLLTALLLGAAMAAQFGLGWPLPLRTTLAWHVGWALGGWVFTLLAGVAATVLPMFWQTPRPPNWLQRWQPWLLWVPLLAGCLGVSGWQPMGWLALLLLAGAGLYAVLRAKRRHDAVWPLWLAAAWAWVIVALLGLLGGWLPKTWPLAWWMGVLALVGGAVLPVNAMLGKIIPFLAWLHLRKRLPARIRVPAMQTLLPPAVQRGQAGLALLSLAGLLVLPLAPASLVLPVGLLFSLSQAWLGAQLLWVLSRFIRLLRGTVACQV